MVTRIKRSLSTALVNQFSMNKDLVLTHKPTAGDVAVFRVVEGDNKYVRDVNGANQYLFENDLILGVFGSRYATNQLEAYVPTTKSDPLHLVGRGGVVATIRSTNNTFKGIGVSLQLEAYAVNDRDQVINTIELNQLEAFEPKEIKAKVILSIGSSMDSGKTTTAAYLCKGLVNAGAITAYMKLTGTVYNKDRQLVYDRGAHMATDFSAFGFPSTYMFDKETLLDLYQSLYLKIEQACAPDVIVVEIADGILQRETQFLLNDKAFMSTIDGVILSCGDSLGAISGLHVLRNINIEPFALSGLFTASDLLMDEVRAVVDTPVLNLQELLNPDKVAGLLRQYAMVSMAA